VAREPREWLMAILYGTKVMQGFKAKPIDV